MTQYPHIWGMDLKELKEILAPHIRSHRNGRDLGASGQTGGAAATLVCGPVVHALNRNVCS